jgi:hypothetical protein
MMTDNPAPSVRELRNFGLMMGGFIAAIFGLLIPWIWDLEMARWPWITAAIFIAWGLAAPATLASVFHLWMKLGGVLGWINTRLLLAMVFYLMFFPLGVIMRLFGWDAMQRKLNANLQSYRSASKVRARDNMENPF